MCEHEILTSGEKVKKLRKKYRITQQELANKIGITRNAISMIENNTMKLNNCLCKNIANTFICLTNHIDFKEDELIDYLCETKDEQIINFLDEFKREVKIQKISQKDNFDKVQELNSYVVQNKLYEIKNEIVYEKIAEMYKELYLYGESKIYINKCLQIVKSSDIELKCYHKLILLELKSGENYEYIFSLNKTAHKIRSSDSTTFKKIDYNTAKAYIMSCKFDKGIDLLQQIENKYSLENYEQIDILNLKGNCFLKLKNYNEAEKFYLQAFKLSTETEDNEAICAISQNLSLLYLEINDYDNINKYTDIAQDTTVFRGNKNDYVRNLYYMIIIQMKRNNYKYISENYILLLNEAIELNDKKIQIKSIRELVKYFIKCNERNSLIVLLSIIEQKLAKNELQYKEISDSFMVASNYFYNLDKEKYLQYFNLSIKILEKFFNSEDYEI